MANLDPTIVDTREGSNDKEMIKDATFNIYAGDEILLKDVVDLLRLKGYNVKNAVFAYKSLNDNMFIYCGKEADTEPATIPLTDIGNQLILRIRTSGETQKVATRAQTSAKVRVADKKEHTRRNKERKIGEVIEKVGKWRALYKGAPDGSGKIVKLSLDDAAKHIGIAKKTLDDYLLQLRAGRRYKFDFQQNKDMKVGVLRAFVKQHKNKERDDKAKQPNSEQSSDGIFAFEVT